MALYVLIAIDGLNESHVIATFILSTEDTESLTDMTTFNDKTGKILQA